MNNFSNCSPLESIQNFIKNIPNNVTIGIDEIRTPFIFEKIFLIFAKEGVHKCADWLDGLITEDFTI